MYRYILVTSYLIYEGFLYPNTKLNITQFSHSTQALTNTSGYQTYLYVQPTLKPKHE